MSDTLIFSFIGYETQEIPLEGQTKVDAELSREIDQLDEVVVVGYGTQAEEDVTGAVSSVDPEEFANEPVTSAASALQGRASGVQVVRNGGAPGNTGSIRIRGTGTVNNADPLVVIDGVPAGGIDDVDPESIQSIEVLKDASAAAIYGNRAANGVVLITTKRGSFGQDLSVNVSVSGGVSSPVKTLDMLEASELAMLRQESYQNDGVESPAIWAVDSLQAQRTQWQDELLGTGSVQDYSLAIRGGSEQSAFSVSGSYFDDRGMIENSYFRRYNLRINSDHQIGDLLRVKQNLLLARTQQNELNTTSSQTGVIWSAIRFHPGLPVQWTDGSYSSAQISGEFGDINNPLFTVNTQDEDTKRNRVLGNVEGELALYEDLSLKANIGLEYETTNRYDFNIIVSDQIRTSARNNLYRRYNEFYSLLTELSLNYNATLADDHSLEALGGYSVQTFNADGFSAERSDFSDESEDQRVMTSGNTITGADGSRTDDGLQSFIGRVNYSFRDKYLLTTSFRIDGSSRFAEDNQWGYFPAASIGWRLSDEGFFQDLTSAFDNLMLTAGWGRSGNQQVARLQYLGLYSRGARYTFGTNQVVGARQIRIPNEDISWETVEMTNVGLNMSFLDDRLQAKAEYFIKDTEDMLLSPPTIGTIGTAAVPDVNTGAVRNQGLEMQLSYGTVMGGVDLNVSGNASFIRNEVVELNSEFLASQRYGRPNQEIARTFEGEPIATFYGWRTDGLYQTQQDIDADPNVANDPRQEDIQPGDVRFVDLTGDGIVNGDDREIIGNPHPDVTYGFSAQAGYRSFDLKLFFVGAAGADIFNADRMQGLDPTYPFNMYEETLQRWTGEGTSNSIPRMTKRRDNLNHRSSDLFIESGDYLRLKTLTLGYTLPAAMLDRFGLGDARLYVTGQNVLTFTPYSGLDPELGYIDGNLQLNADYARYPQARTWTIGANITI